MPATGENTSSSSSSPSETLAPPPPPGIPNTPNVAVKPPSKLMLRENAAENWKTYKQQWHNYAIVANLAAQTEEYQVALFLHCLGTDALRVYNGLPFADETDKTKLSKIMEKLDEFAIGEMNETYERYVFNSRNQEADESIDAYVATLRKLAHTCNFCSCLHDTLIRDRIVLGVRSTQLRKRLLQERKLTLKKCVDMCRSSEATSSQLQAITGNAKMEEVNKLRQRDSRGKTPRREFKTRNPRSEGNPKRCKFCCGDHPFKKQKCPAWGAKCDNCGGRNHFASACLKSKNAKMSQRSDTAVKQIDTTVETSFDSDSDSSDVDFITSITTTVNVSAVKSPKSGYAKEIYTVMEIGNQAVKFQVDCGASINIITEKLMGDSPITPTTKRLVMWNKSEITPLGSTRMILRNPKNRNKYSVEFVVVKENLTPLIGAQAAQHMKLITVNEDNFVTTASPSTQQTEVKLLNASEEVIKRFSDVFDRKVGTFPGKVHLEVESSAEPVIIPSRRIPTALKSKFKEELKKLVDDKIITPVDQPTPWVNSLVVTTKKSGALRVCVDPRPLNKALKRETYQMPVLDEVLPELAQAKVFSTADLRSGFWHCVLDDESSLLTTFSTPYGRYRWLRLPFGLSVSPEIFQKHVNQALEGLEGILNIADDILVYGVGETAEQANADHDKKLGALLQRCRERGIALNRDKLKLRVKRVKFMGHVLTDNGLEPDPEKIEAIKAMPKPQNVEDVQRLNGFVTYLAKFLPKLADVMEPIRRLTRKETDWCWSVEQETAFEKVKDLATTAPVLSYYDPTCQLEVQCDASQKGLGAALMQRGQPIAYISRALTPTEQRYAQIEKECLAIVYALERFHQYTFGRRVLVHSDHKPLESIMKKPLASAPRRLQGMLMRLQKYDATVSYERGKNMFLADLLSRAYLPTGAKPEDEEFEFVNMASYIPIADPRLEEIRQENQQDEVMQVLMDVILQGWPDDKSAVPSLALPYFNQRDELTVQNGLIFRGERVVIPAKLRESMKTKIHSSHMGAEACLRRARECIFWPGMSAEMKQLVESCEICRQYESAQPRETMRSQDPPTRPWERIATDLFSYQGKEFLITVDYYSNFWEIDHLPSPTATAVITKLKNHFARYGCPDAVVSDNGSQFTSLEFAQFKDKWKFKHRTISPGNSKANGKVEASVKTAKQLLRKSDDIHLALLDHRNTITQGMTTSPAQRLMNRRTKTLLPVTENLLQPQVPDQEEQHRRLRKRQQTQAHYYNRTARDLPKLELGDVVRMKPIKNHARTWRKATVTQQVDDRSYVVETPDGASYRRNRFHLRKSGEPAPPTPVEPVAMAPESATEEPPPQNESTTLHSSPSSPVAPPAVPVQAETRPSRPARERKPPAYLQNYVCY